MRVSKRLIGRCHPGVRLPHLSHVRAATTDPSLVVYNAQHEELIDEVEAQFTEDTGIEVELRNGSDLELANQIVAEGTARRPTCS